MARSRIITQSYKSLCIDKISFDIKQVTVKGKNSISVAIRNESKTGEKQQLVVETPYLFAPRGADRWDESGEFNIFFSLDPMDEHVHQFQTFLKQLDNKICQFISKNKMILQQLGMAQYADDEPETLLKLVKMNYNAIVKPGKQKDDGTFWPPFFSPKVRHDKDMPNKINTICEIPDLENESAHNVVELTTDNIRDCIPPLCKCRCVLAIDRVWFISNKCGIVCRIKKLRVQPKVQNIYDWVEDDEDVEEEDVEMDFAQEEITVIDEEEKNDEDINN